MVKQKTMTSTTTGYVLYSYAFVTGTQTPNTGVNTMLVLSEYSVVPSGGVQQADGVCLQIPVNQIIANSRKVVTSSAATGNYTELTLEMVSTGQPICKWVSADATQVAALFPSGFQTFCSTLITGLANQI